MKERKIIINLIIIIIFLIIVFLLIRQFGIINAKIPTGNIDIFDINFIENGTCNHDDLNNIFVYDEQVEYSNNTKLNIFSHKSYYVKSDAIAPDSQNSYQFVVRNNNDFAITYNLRMEENNPHNINMKYRLKLDGKYILGNNKEWVTSKELIENEVVLADKSYNVYTLDWKWFESNDEVDTKIGTNIDANYQLSISFLANRY